MFFQALTSTITHKPIAVRGIDLTNFSSIEDVNNYEQTRLFVTYGSLLLGHIDVRNDFTNISAMELKSIILDNFSSKLARNFEIQFNQNGRTPAKPFIEFPIKNNSNQMKLDNGISVTIVLATLDRPDALEETLKDLQKQNTKRNVEIIVVDNNPESATTKEVINKFSNIILVNEARKGLAYARNAGLLNAKGDIIITTDDDVFLNEDWLEKLVSPFTRNDVMAVTGNVLPLSLETPAQQLFEEYGGLGKGYKKIEANEAWFHKNLFRAVPTWELGATANAAFRRSIFTNPNIGLMEETLGPGMPSGVGEDTYLFYKILKAGFTIIYEPDAFLFHKHRFKLHDLKKQLYNYSKGHVAYHLTTVFKNHDLRGLFRIFVELPFIHTHRILKRLLGKTSYPLNLLFLEIKGNVAAPIALIQSWLRVKNEGRSQNNISQSH